MKSLPITPAVLSLTLSAAAFAQCNVHRYGVPDFDQRRWGLHANNGAMHCVPTSSLNWMGYLSNHGFPAAMGYNASNWANNSHHPHVTNRLDVMGDLSITNTTPTSGTTGGNGVKGINDYLDQYNVNLNAVVSYKGAKGSWAPSPKLMYNLMKAGCLVNFCYGRYDWEACGWVRTGGHCMTLVGVDYACGSYPVLKFHNPNTDPSIESIWTQSVPQTETWTVEKLNSVYACNTRDQWQKYPSSGQIARKFIDGVITIVPMFGCALPPVRANGIQLHRLSFLTNERHQEEETILTPDNAPVITAFPFAGDPGAFVITRGSDIDHPSLLYFYDMVERTWTRLEEFESNPVGAIQDRFGNIYINFGNSVQKYHVGDREVLPIASVTPVYPISAMTLNDATDELHLLSSTESRILTFPLGDLSRTPFDRRLPTSVDLRGDALLSYNPELQRIFLSSTEASSIWGLTPNIATPIWDIADAMAVPDGAQDLLSMQFTDRGVFALHSRNGYDEYEREALSGRLVPTTTPLFRGRQISGFLNILRSQHDFDARTATPDQWLNLENPDVDADSQIECRADFNFDGVVDFFDYLDFVDAFAEDNMNADFNYDGIVDFFDYLDFVDAFSEGC